MTLLFKFIRLSGKEKLLFFEALLFLWYSKILLKILPFKKCTDLLLPSDRLTKKPNPLLLTEVRKAISRANKTAVWKNVCLVKSFAARFMLQRRGIASTMYLGLQVEEEGAKKLHAHAWLISNDIIITPKLTGFKEIHQF